MPSPSTGLDVINVPCAVCEELEAPALFLLPGDSSCTSQYTGYLFAIGSQHICLDVDWKNTDSIVESSGGQLNPLTVMMGEGSTEELVTCAVCSMLLDDNEL